MRRTALLAVSLFFLFLPAHEARAFVSGDVKSGNAHFESMEYEEALKKYEKALDKKPESDIINYDAGLAHYKLGDYKKAETAFQKSILTDDGTLEGMASYNMGNTKYRQGQPFETSEKKGAIKLYKESLGYFKRAMELMPEDEDAKFNYEFVKNKLAELERGQKQEEQEDQDKDQENKDQKQDQENQDNKDQKNKDQKKNEQKQEQQEDQDKDQENKNEEGQEREQENKEEKQNDQDNKEQGEKDKQKEQEKEQQKDQEQQKEKQKNEEQKKQDEKQEKEDREEQRKKREQEERENRKKQEEEKRKEEQKKREEEKKKQEEQKKRGQSEKPEETPRPAGGSQGPQPRPDEMTEAEALMLLEGFRQEEESKGEPVNVYRGTYEPSYKDW